jgi:hypothetical protein
MADAFNRWSQLVRTPGAVEIMAHHEIAVPPLGSELPYTETRPGLRLLVRPLDGSAAPWTIDITATNVIAMLEGFLRSGAHVGMRLAWSARGYGVRRKDTVRLRPIQAGE